MTYINKLLDAACTNAYNNLSSTLDFVYPMMANEVDCKRGENGKPMVPKYVQDVGECAITVTIGTVGLHVLQLFVGSLSHMPIILGGAYALTVICLDTGGEGRGALNEILKDIFPPALTPVKDRTATSVNGLTVAPFPPISQENNTTAKVVDTTTDDQDESNDLKSSSTSVIGSPNATPGRKPPKTPGPAPKTLGEFKHLSLIGKASYLSERAQKNIVKNLSDLVADNNGLKKDLLSCAQYVMEVSLAIFVLQWSSGLVISALVLSGISYVALATCLNDDGRDHLNQYISFTKAWNIKEVYKKGMKDFNSLFSLS